MDFWFVLPKDGDLAPPCRPATIKLRLLLFYTFKYEASRASPLLTAQMVLVWSRPWCKPPLLLLSLRSSAGLSEAFIDFISLCRCSRMYLSNALRFAGCWPVLSDTKSVSMPFSPSPSRIELLVDFQALNPLVVRLLR